MKRLMLILSGLCIAMVLLGGCASVGVDVWERDILAKQEMKLDDHIYFSKEGSSGGRGFGGGGCGCN